jgi:NB-ARC domain/TIR domain
MAAIFLSYARGDDGEPFEPQRSFVARLARDLQERGCDVWFDRVSMPSRSLTFHQEIRDAISACERLLLVVGPQAVSSDYVRQEWQFAYFQADKFVTPILRRGDFPLVPDELKLLHCEDFRDEAQYEFHLAQLARILEEPLPRLGALIGVPSLPAHFLSRTDRLVVIRDALRADLDRPVVISGAAAKVGLHGMGGIGKSVLASALAHDRKIREAFPDGIVWVGLGPLPDLAELQRRVHRDLGGDGAIANEQEGRTQLKNLLADKAVLLVIDDVWRRGDVDAFNVLGPRCRAMLTTRDAGLLASVGGTHHVVGCSMTRNRSTSWPSPAASHETSCRLRQQKLSANAAGCPWPSHWPAG